MNHGKVAGLFSRFMKYTIPDGDCIVWTASTDRDGYGHILYRGRLRIASRLIYELTVGKIPDGLTIDHLCRNRACVKPEHLEAVSLRTNILRGNNPAAVNARKKGCSKGHDFERMKPPYQRHRQCPVCVKEKDRNRGRVRG